jgi:AcrR family transcriptional regulator
MKTRTYELKRRAEQQNETRQRIVAAVAALHREVGPARTTIAAIAERAGVERLTVYRHFADESELFTACSAHFRAELPPPAGDEWASVVDPAERLRAAVLAFYAYYRAGEPMIANVRRDAPQLPALAAVLAPAATRLRATVDELATRWRRRGARHKQLVAVIAHALRFETWQSLVRGEGLSDREAADLMVDLAKAAATERPPAKRR